MEMSVQKNLPPYVTVADAIRLLEDATGTQWSLPKLRHYGANVYFLVPKAWASELSTNRNNPQNAYWAPLDPLDITQLWAIDSEEDRIFVTLIVNPEGLQVAVMDDTLSLQRKDLRIKLEELDAVMVAAKVDAVAIAEPESGSDAQYSGEPSEGLAANSKMRHAAMGLTKSEVIEIFAPMMQEWRRDPNQVENILGMRLKDPPDSWKECRVQKGGRGKGRSALWNPAGLAAIFLEDEKFRILGNVLEGAFANQKKLQPWRDEWERFAP